MSEDSQIVVPPSFIALYVDPGRSRPRLPREEIAARHEHCDDLANLLTEHARTRQWELGVTEADVLERIHRGLLSGDGALPAPEACWVLCRLAELLDWPQPQFEDEPGGQDGLR
ncbi:ATPase with chaperone activity [Rubrivivax sp. A210]|uniref:ATPase with chaperone activity n=1 Tax=Rubrivivax sp. A210 TaxID=2772301 RepID=UPI001919D764|nr:ATPase with chaperone activity [Rubrivivax sp. A210]CAD5365855.1 ATPase with chaperone activity [Rubrivivax sp. A210]